MPMFSPYHRFWFTDGFDVVPPPTGRYNPSSGNLLLQFVPPSLSSSAVSDTRWDAGKISVGSKMSERCWRFNFHDVNLGCDSTGPDCVFNVTGARFDQDSGSEQQVISETVHVQACPLLQDCDLARVSFGGFDELTSILITLKVDGQAKTWWADDFRLGWSNNTCDAAVCRSKVRDSIRGRASPHRSRDAKQRRLIRDVGLA